jgi:diguanylate cyclase (GGDEF)-like protein
VRGGDLFARYGGEEFAAIVPNATMDDLDSIAQRMRVAVAELAIEHQTPAGHVTLSIGGAAKAASDVRSEQGLIELADAALYRAKERGRDRAVLDPELVIR